MWPALLFILSVFVGGELSAMLTATNSHILTFDYNCCYYGLVINNNTINRVLEEMSHRDKNVNSFSRTIQASFPRLSWVLSLEVFANFLSKNHENRVISGGQYKL